MLGYAAVAQHYDVVDIITPVVYAHDDQIERCREQRDKGLESVGCQKALQACMVGDALLIVSRSLRVEEAHGLRQKRKQEREEDTREHHQPAAHKHLAVGPHIASCCRVKRSFAFRLNILYWRGFLEKKYLTVNMK